MYYLDENNFYRDDLDDREVMVTVRCITYNHEKFIGEALEGFVMQKTNFRFEVIVHDDASTDGTADVIREYAEKYPSIIKPIFETENQFSKHDGSLTRILNQHTRGKYIAFCEGDDYWTDPDKLQKQVDFLETNPDFVLCFHRCKWHYEDGEGNDGYSPELLKNEYTSDELIRTWYCSTASMIFRNSVYRTKEYKDLFSRPFRITGDLPMQALLGHLGKLHGINEVMSVYRKHAGGISNIMPSMSFKVVRQYVGVKKFFKGEVDKSLNYHIGQAASHAIWLMRTGKIKEGWNLWFYCFRNAPIDSLKASWKRGINHLKKKQ